MSTETPIQGVTDTTLRLGARAVNRPSRLSRSLLAGSTVASVRPLSLADGHVASDTAPAALETVG